MKKFEVTYSALSPVFRNSEIEITSDKADQIREELAKATATHQPIVHGRDWEGREITAKYTTVVEGDYYSVSNNGTAHFYKDQSQAPSASVLNVIHVREIPGVTIGGGGGGEVGWDTSGLAKYVTGQAGQTLPRYADTYTEAIKDFEALVRFIKDNPRWARMLSRVEMNAGKERLEIMPAYPGRSRKLPEGS